MNIASCYQPGRLGLSFEIFPPRTLDGAEALGHRIDALLRLNPDFFTCTYGAGGSTRDKTLDVLEMVLKRRDLPVASHLTCVGSTYEQLAEYIRECIARGVHNIVALRGDPPVGTEEFRPTEGGPAYGNELVAFLRREFPTLGIAVAGYPEVHQEALDARTDLINLKRKVDAGADLIITQLFFDNADYHRFREQCEKIGIRVPIVPGILPVTNLPQIKRITGMCGAALPAGFVARLGYRDDPQWQLQVGVEHAIVQVRDLIDQRVPGIHFYVLNQSHATGAVLRALALRGV